jgi:hypothetical protein
MSSMRLRAVETAFAICLLAPFSQSVPAQDAQICVDVARPPEQRVPRCTQALQQPVMGPSELAGYIDQYSHALLGITYRGMLLDLRANALTVLGKRDEAIADFTEALALNETTWLRF